MSVVLIPICAPNRCGFRSCWRGVTFYLFCFSFLMVSKSKKKKKSFSLLLGGPIKILRLVIISCLYFSLSLFLYHLILSFCLYHHFLFLIPSNLHCSSPWISSLYQKKSFFQWCSNILLIFCFSSPFLFTLPVWNVRKKYQNWSCIYQDRN